MDIDLREVLHNSWCFVELRNYLSIQNYSKTEDSSCGWNAKMMLCIPTFFKWLSMITHCQDGTFLLIRSSREPSFTGNLMWIHMVKLCNLYALHMTMDETSRSVAWLKFWLPRYRSLNVHWDRMLCIAEIAKERPLDLLIIQLMCPLYVSYSNIGVLSILIIKQVSLSNRSIKGSHIPTIEMMSSLN